MYVSILFLAADFTWLATSSHLQAALHRNEGDLDFQTYIYEHYFYYYYPRCNSNADIALIADAQGEAR